MTFGIAISDGMQKDIGHFQCDRIQLIIPTVPDLITHIYKLCYVPRLLHHHQKPDAIPTA